MPHPATDKLHMRRAQRIVLGELELGGENAALERGALGALDERLPLEHVVLGDGAGGDAIWRVCREVLVLVEQAFLRDRGHGGLGWGCGGLRGGGDERRIVWRSGRVCLF